MSVAVAPGLTMKKWLIGSEVPAGAFPAHDVPVTLVRSAGTDTA